MERRRVWRKKLWAWVWAEETWVYYLPHLPPPHTGGGWTIYLPIASSTCQSVQLFVQPLALDQDRNVGDPVDYSPPCCLARTMFSQTSSCSGSRGPGRHWNLPCFYCVFATKSSNMCVCLQLSNKLMQCETALETNGQKISNKTGIKFNIEFQCQPPSEYHSTPPQKI